MGEKDLAALLPNIAAQARGVLGSLRLASIQLAPAEAREKDPALDRKAALLDQSYYRLLRLVNNLSLAACMTEERPLRLRDQDLVSLVGEYCERAAGLAEMAGVNLRRLRRDQLCPPRNPALWRPDVHLQRHGLLFHLGRTRCYLSLLHQQGRSRPRLVQLPL